MGNLSQTSKDVQVLKTMSIKLDYWIVDSRATDHMTDNLALFNEIQLCSGNNVKVAVGKHTNIIGIGTTHTTDKITLIDVKYASNLKFDLLIVPQLRKALKCSVNMFVTGCIF